MQYHGKKGKNRFQKRGRENVKDIKKNRNGEIEATIIYNYHDEQIIKGTREYINSRIKYGGFYKQDFQYADEGFYMICNECGLIEKFTRLREDEPPSCQNHPGFGHWNRQIIVKINDNLHGRCDNTKCKNRDKIVLVDIIDMINDKGHTTTCVACLECKYKGWIPRWPWD